MTHVTVDSTWFADHSLVYGTFSPIAPETAIPIWRKPKPVEWPSYQEDDLIHHQSTSTPGGAPSVDDGLCSIFGDLEAWGDAKLHEKFGKAGTPVQP